jgi:hypothetical protein
MTDNEQGSLAHWLPVFSALIATTLVVLDRLDIAAGLSWWNLPIITLVALVIAVVFTCAQENIRGGRPWLRVFAFRVGVIAAAGAWATWADLVGFQMWPILVASGGTVALCALGAVCRTPLPAERQYVNPGDDKGPRTPDGRYWQQIIRSVAQIKAVVIDWETWEDTKDGLRLFVEMPADRGVTTSDFAVHAARLAAAAKLPRGCAVRVLDGAHQGVVVVDVMLRNVLVGTNQVHDEPTTPASINDDFPILTSPRGDVFTICLRITSAVIGGTVGSGKTTLLHRIIMWLARCTDAMVWVVDLNGGGLAEPWISPWLDGKARKPVVDWVADNEAEAAAMVAVAGAIARDRKKNDEAKRRKEAVDDTVLPVDERMPAIVVLTDEGGEVRQAAGQIGFMIGEGITRLAQIGRAEGVRVIMSVLRGTSDLTDKALRVASAIRICLRMEEQEEYSHVLGVDPGKVELSGAVGAGYLKTATIYRPVLGQTRNVKLSGIKRHAIATGDLRPDLDPSALRAAAKVTPASIVGGKDPSPHMGLRVFKDAAAGLLYERRWDRYAERAAEMRGEEYAHDTDDQQDVQAVAPDPGSVLAGWAARMDQPVGDDRPEESPAVAGGARIYQFPTRGNASARFPEPTTPMPSTMLGGPTAREQILVLLADAHPQALSSKEIEQGVTAGKTRVFDLLKQMREDGTLAQNANGGYVRAPAGVRSPAG